jgi:hypothetical protein
MAATQLDVSESTLRRIFRQARMLECVKKGEISEKVLASRHPAPSFEPFCTRSQILSYHDPSGKKVAIAHQYLRPDGTIGASGLPDPKFVVHGGIRYRLRA